MTTVDSGERAMLREVARDFLSKAASSARVRAVMDSGGMPDRRLGRELGELGWFGLEIPEALGGAGAGLSELVVILEEMGAHAASAPVLSSAVLCAGAILLAGTADQQQRWLPALAAGTAWGTAVLPGWFESEAERDDEITAARAPGGWVLNGSAAFVLDARVADLLVVAARSGDGWVTGIVERTSPGVAVQAIAMTDATRCIDSVRLDGAVLADADVLSAQPGPSRSLIGALVNRAAVALAADSVGNSQRVLDMTVTYARQREQFGRPIGSFQAVKHRAADMLVDTETSRLLMTDGASAVATDPAGATVPAAMAKEYACEKAAGTAGAGVQLHGGIGYTWEHDMHIYLKRAKLNEQLFGSGLWHRARIADRIFRADAAR